MTLNELLAALQLDRCDFDANGMISSTEGDYVHFSDVAQKLGDFLRAQADSQPVAEVVLIDPELCGTWPKKEPYKDIDCSQAWIDAAPLGTKLYEHPAPEAAQALSEAEINRAMTLAHRWAMATYNKGLGKQYEDFEPLRKELRAILTRASAVTADQCPHGIDDGACKCCYHAATVAEPSAEYHKQLTELADELDAELNSGAKWSKAQHTCNSVSIALREIAEKQAQALSKSDWMKRALEAEELNRKFMDRWNAENGPTHMGEPVIAKRQLEPSAPNFACYLIDKCERETVTEENVQRWLGAMMASPQYAGKQAAQQQAEPVGDGREARNAEISKALRRIDTSKLGMGEEAIILAAAIALSQPAAQSGQRAGVASDVEAACTLLEAKEYAEHWAKTDLGKRLEAALTALHNEARMAVQLEELTRAIVKQHKERGTFLIVHMDNLGDLLREMDEDRATDDAKRT